MQDWQRDTYLAMFTARAIDERERELISQGMAHFHVSGAGHESTASLTTHLRPTDWLHLHYRDKALLLARGVSINEFFSSFLARCGSHSAGRQMSAHFSSPALNILSMVGPVGNNALQAVGVAAAIKPQLHSPIVVCSVGDGTTQQGEFLEAIAEAVRWQLPVLFLVEDNRYSISTPTRGRTFFDLPSGPIDSFFGLQITHVDGSDVMTTNTCFAEAVADIRLHRGPRLVLLNVERLTNHTNSDDQEKYRDPNEIAKCLITADPLIKFRKNLIENGVSEDELTAIECDAKEAVEAAIQQALSGPDPDTVFHAKRDFPASMINKPEYRGDASEPRLTMREAISGVLSHHLETDDRVILYGQDIEDPKGDVFGVTRGLSTAFPNRVINSPLSESTIIGTCIGRALAGQRPVAFIQFADFLPLAFNQIASELGSMFWRTNGGWQCPVVIMVTCGGYKPGLGPFHAQSMEGFAAHVPGIDVVMPSSAGDAAGLLNAALESPRPTIFFYPKSCLNLRERSTSRDVSKQFVIPGKSRKLATGSDLTLVTWGNPVSQCLEATRTFEDFGNTIDLFDLRSMSPWDDVAILASVDKTGRLLVVHEDNRTCGFGAEILATVGERITRPIMMRRITRADTYVPYHFDNQLEVLPSYKWVLEACADLLECDLTWQKPKDGPPGQTVIRAIGSGPADETVRIVAIRVKVGDTVTAGQVVAEVEATKSVVDVVASESGVVLELSALVGAQMRTNDSLMLLQTSEANSHQPLPVSRENPGIPLLRQRATKSRNSQTATNSVPPTKMVGIVDVVGITGSRVVTNEELIVNWPHRTPQDIFRLTGIESRRWIDASLGETVLSLAVLATKQLLERQKLTIHDIDLVIACTTTPDIITPSLACRVAASVALDGESPTLAAYDINAACSGYLYALAQAWDYLQQQPSSRVLVITSEVLSPLLDMQDFDTAILFGDAATATLVASENAGGGLEDIHLRSPNAALGKGSIITIAKPVLSGTPHCDNELVVPLTSRGTIEMSGASVFRQAIRSMYDVLQIAASRLERGFESIDIIVPHQANQRLLDALQTRVKRSVFSCLSKTGNCSSSSIPLALELFARSMTPQIVALLSFGGGYTSAACIGTLQLNRKIGDEPRA